jgi:hypothetical protein
MSRQYNNILKHLQEHFDINTTLNDYCKMDEKIREFTFTCKLKKHINTLKHTSYVNKRSLFNKENKPLQDFCVHCVDEKNKKSDIENYKEQILEKTGHLLLSYDSKSRDTEYICGNCNEYSKTHMTNLLHHNLGNCSKCQHEKFKLSYDKLKQDIETHGFKLLTKPEEYVSNKQKLDVICKCGYQYQTYLVSIRQDKHCKVNCKTEKYEKTCNEKYNERNVMHIDDIFHKSQINQITNKEYTFENNNKIIVQGTEDLTINYLLKHKNRILQRIIKEDEILVKNIPSFKYIYEEKEHKYYPDIYIKDTKLIIESKSIYTHNRQGPLKNYCKYKSVNNNGYDIMIVMINDYRKIVDIWYFLRDGSEISTLKEEDYVDINFKEKLSCKSKITCL